MFSLGLRSRAIVGFSLGALLLLAALAVTTYVLAGRYLVEQRDRSASRQVVVNATLLDSRLTSVGTDPAEALASLRTGEGVDALLLTGDAWLGGSVRVGPEDIPTELVATVQAGTPSLQRYRNGGVTVLAAGAPLSQGGAYFEVTALEQTQRTLQLIGFVGLLATVITAVLGAVLAWWVTGRVLRPLDDVAVIASRLAAGDLSARVPSTDDRDLAVIAGSFNGMADTLSRRIERDAQFAADVSHELRSPLTTMTASVSVLEGRREEMPSVCREAVDLLGGDVTRFARLLEDLLDLARDYEPLTRESLVAVDLGELARQVLHDAGHQEVPVDVPQAAPGEEAANVRVEADPRRLERVVANLIENADMHGDGVVRVEVTPTPSGVRLAVEDAGLGVAPEDRDAIFQRFSRGSRARGRGTATGTGLGLSLVHEHVRAHDGVTWYEDRPGGGARFCVELPKAPS